MLRLTITLLTAAVLLAGFGFTMKLESPSLDEVNVTAVAQDAVATLHGGIARVRRAYQLAHKVYRFVQDEWIADIAEPYPWRETHEKLW